jgi:hypothetical protein
MHITTKAYLSHTRHCHLARDLHPYVRCVVPVARNHLKFFGILMDPSYDVLQSLGIFRPFFHIIVII